MSRATRSVPGLLGLMLLSGCGGSPAQDTPEARADIQQRPLTTAIWEQSTDPEKFSKEVLVQLRRDNPEIASRDQWKKYYQETVVPGFREQILGESAVASAE